MKAGADNPRAGAALSDLSNLLNTWIFTDLRRAEAVLGQLDAAEILAADRRMDYYEAAAFMDNQFRRFEAALDNLDRALEMAVSGGRVFDQIRLLADRAGVLLNNRDWVGARRVLETARQLVTAETNPRLVSHLECREGFLNLHQGHYRQAMVHFLNASRELDESETLDLKDCYILTLVLSGLGDLYERLGERQKSQEAYTRVLPIVESKGLWPRLAWHYLHAGRAALSGGNHAGAKYWFLRVVEVATAGDREACTHALGNLGIMAQMEDDRKKAEEMFSLAGAQYDPPQKSADYTNLSRVALWQSGLLLKYEGKAAATQQLLQAWATGLQGKDEHHLSQVAQQLAVVYAGQAQYKDAFEWQQRVTRLQQEHFVHLRDSERQELEARFQLEKNLQDAKIARLRVSGLQLKALRAQMNPHFLFNSLNAIQGLITSGRNSDAEYNLAKFAKMMRHTLDYSDLEVVTLSEEIEFLERYLEINKRLRFRDKLFFQIDVHPGFVADEVEVPTMILQPFVENAIEHGLRPVQEGRLQIRFEPGRFPKTLLCVISDDGVGYNKGREKNHAVPGLQKHRSRGMEITRERLSLIHQLEETGVQEAIFIVDLGVESDGAASGTRVEVHMPISDVSDT